MSGPRRALPAPADELRAHLPAIEPDRQVSDWGRSERVEGLMDKTIYDWLYHYWFRVEVEGIELFVSIHPAGRTTAFAGRPNPRSQTSSSPTTL